MMYTVVETNLEVLFRFWNTFSWNQKTKATFIFLRFDLSSEGGGMIRFDK